MDRTSRIGLAVCLILLIGIQFALDKIYPPAPPKPRPAATVSTSPTAIAPPTHMTAEPPAPGEAPPSSAPVIEKLSVIENDAIKVTFTSAGAAIAEIELKGQKADNGGNIILNEQSHSNVLSLTGWPGVDTASFQVQENGGEGVAYTANLPNGVKWQRTYTFGKEKKNDAGMSGYLRKLFHWLAVKMGQPETKPLIYTLDVDDTLTNTGATDVTLPSYSLSVGRAAPLRVAGHYQEISNMYLGSGWLADHFHLTTVSDFAPGYFLFYQTRNGKDQFSSQTLDPSPLRWIGVENQFFTILLTPAAERSIQSGVFRCYNPREPDGSLVVKRDPENYILPGYEPDIEAAATFPAISLPASKSITVNYDLYAGPKDFNRLDALGANQGALMNYDGVVPFSLLIVPMLTVLHFWYLIFHNYGVAIILLTLMIKAITWPLQSIANRSGKRMQALAPKLKELQAKYKETPEKLQTETFALYREYGVNPFGGCLPALVQMPVFFSLYFMLQNAVELRGQSFFWVHDLTQPDTLVSWALPFVIPFLNTSHLAIHPLPIMVTALTMVMMRMTPQIGDPTQAKVAQFMPLIFLFIFYNFAAALSLYYVINNAVSIIQIYRNLRKPMPELKRVPRKKTTQGASSK
jgi:YidC/Oxa1 family membrane protein insertase